MAIPRYRVIDSKGAYAACSRITNDKGEDVPCSELVQLAELGGDRKAAAAYGVRAVICEPVYKDWIIETTATPGPQFEAMNPEAEVALAAYWKRFPNATLDPTRHMPLGQDPMGGKSVEQLVSGLLEQMDRDAMAKQPVAVQPAADMTALLASVKALADGQATLQAAIAALITAPQHKPSRT